MAVEKVVSRKTGMGTVARQAAAGGVENPGRALFVVHGWSLIFGLVPSREAMDKHYMRLPPLLLSAGRLILDFALPPRCPGCGAITAGQQAFCQPCWSQMRFLGDPCCARCGAPFALDPGAEGAECGACIADPPRWNSARAVLAYGDVSRTVAMRLKYGRRTGLARLMAHYMAPLATRMADGEGALLVPVPLHRWRLWNRGFNQAALVVRHIAAITGLPADVLLLSRTRRTRSLRDMNARAREREVRGAFALDPARSATLSGKRVILIDDIHTSGATARACVAALQAGGAAEVHLLCWARVVKDAASD